MKTILILFCLCSVAWGFDERLVTEEPVTISITGKNSAHYLSDKTTFNDAKKEISFIKNTYPLKIKGEWAMFHDGENVSLFESDGTGTLQTYHTIFAGTEKECQAEIEKLKLKQLQE